MKWPGLILAGMQSSSGKTAITCLLSAGFKKRNFPIQTFKVGPDFIDGGYHQHYSGVSTRNLDAWLMGKTAVLQEVQKHGAGRISIVEGVMGLFDGSESHSDAGSAMELARWLDWPVVLVVPSARSGRSLAAALRGFIQEAGEGRIIGVILNQITGDSHREYLQEAIAPLKLKILGALPICEELRWKERHLGLYANGEENLPSIDVMASLAERYLDLNGFVEFVKPSSINETIKKTNSTNFYRIGIAKDEAFHFYYRSNLDWLEEQGMKLVEFSPLKDAHLPEGIQGLVIGGGFPEIFAEKLSENKSLRSSLLSFAQSGLPIYAECGGLMLLVEELVDFSGKKFPMAGVVPGRVEMTSRLQDFGYCECSGWEKNPKQVFRGHEFHYSRWSEEAKFANLWEVRHPRKKRSRQEGYSSAGVHASYVHLYYSNYPFLFDFLSFKAK